VPFQNERVGRHLKDKLSGHRWWRDLDRLHQATETHLGQVHARFHTDDHPRIRLVQASCPSA
jgi:hypothetical protein